MIFFLNLFNKLFQTMFKQDLNESSSSDVSVDNIVVEVEPDDLIPRKPGNVRPEYPWSVGYCGPRKPRGPNKFKRAVVEKKPEPKRVVRSILPRPPDPLRMEQVVTSPGTEHVLLPGELPLHSVWSTDGSPPAAAHKVPISPINPAQNVSNVTINNYSQNKAASSYHSGPGTASSPQSTAAKPQNMYQSSGDCTSSQQAAVVPTAATWWRQWPPDQDPPPPAQPAPSSWTPPPSAASNLTPAQNWTSVIPTTSAPATSDWRRTSFKPPSSWGASSARPKQYSAPALNTATHQVTPAPLKIAPPPAAGVTQRLPLPTSSQKILIPVALKTPCKNCGQVITASSLQELKEHSCAGWVCDVPACARKFTTKNAYQYHMKHCHNLQRQQGPLYSDTKLLVTDKAARSSAAGKMSPKKAHVCPYEGCNKSYDVKNHLIQHERLHTGDFKLCIIIFLF